MRLPDFLVIGAMKAGTTSLCNDLDFHPGIFFPSVKEPHTLVLDEVLAEKGRRDYATLFQSATEEQKCGEGSTGYSKIPLHPGVPNRARVVLGPDLKVIYIVRNPITRALSHHYHMYRGGDAPADFETALKTHKLILDVSRYASQLEPWLDTFGRDNIHVVRFETYTDDKEAVVAAASEFLGVAASPHSVKPELISNVGEEQLLPPASVRNVVRRVTRSQWYKRNIHPRTPKWVRDYLKAGIYQKAAERPPLPPSGVIDFLAEEFQGEVERLSAMLGVSEPFWNLQQTCEAISRNRDDVAHKEG